MCYPMETFSIDKAFQLYLMQKPDYFDTAVTTITHCLFGGWAGGISSYIKK